MSSITPLSNVIVLVAGEASGDILGAGLMAALKKRYPSASFVGVGGALMEKQGLVSLFPMERLSVMGITEVLGRLPELLRLRKQLIQRCIDANPLVFIGIDSPDFNLPIAEKLHRSGIATVHYVSPSVWAWRQGRVKSIKQSIDMMLTLLPFEATFYEQEGVPVTFVGHPLANEIPLSPNKKQAREHLAVKQERRVMAVLPGSRAGEVKHVLPVFLAAIDLIHQRYPDMVFLIPAANEARYQQIDQAIKHRQMPHVRVTLGESRNVLTASDVALIASGTATLEAMLLKKPMVVAYRMGKLSHAIISRLVKSPYVSLPNLLAGEEIVPELIQDDMTPDALCEAVSRWIDAPGEVAELQMRFEMLHKSLQQGGSESAAAAIEQVIESHTH